MQRPIPYWGAAISEAFCTRYGQLGWPILTFPANQPPELLKAQSDTYRIGAWNPDYVYTANRRDGL